MIVTINGVNYDSVVEFTLKRETNKINIFEFTLFSSVPALNNVASVTDGGVNVFTGYVTGKDDQGEGLFKYTLSQTSYLLKKRRVSDGGNYSVNISSPTTINNILDTYILPTGWTRANSESSTISGLKFYYTNCLSAIYKLLSANLGLNVWFDDINKKVGFGNNWHDLTSTNITEITEGSTEPLSRFYIKKLGSESSARGDVDQVIVIGSTESIKGMYPTTGVPSDPTLLVFQYDDLAGANEANALAKTLYDDYGQAKTRIELIMTPTFAYNETDLIKVDGVNYTIYDVETTYVETKIGLISGRETIYDILGDSLREVTGEISSAMSMTYDGGLQNIGAPYVNDLITVNVANSQILVDNDFEQFPNGGIAELTTTGTLPAPLLLSTHYYIISATSSNLKLSLTNGGTQINITNAGSGTHTIRRIGVDMSSTFTANASNDILTLGSANTKRYDNGDRVIFTSTGSIPSPLKSNYDYYVRDSTSESFSVTWEIGAGAIALDSDGSGNIRCRNMESMSVPATYNLDISDINSIDNYKLGCDFDYYKEGITVGDDVEFLSKPTIIEEQSSAYWEALPDAGVYISTEMPLLPMKTGFDHGFLFIPCSINIQYSGAGSITFNIECYCTIKKPDGSIWTSPTQSIRQGKKDPDFSTPNYKNFSYFFVLQGSDFQENVAGDSTLTVYFRTNTNYAKHIYFNAQIRVNRLPRHTHAINKTFNVTGSIYPRNVYMKITNIDLIDEYVSFGEARGHTVASSWPIYLDSTNNLFSNGDFVILENPPSPFITGKRYCVTNSSSNYIGLTDRFEGDIIPATSVVNNIIVKKVVYGGIVSGNKNIDIQNQLRTGKNKITMFSDYPGSVYVTGKYDNYGI